MILESDVSENWKNEFENFISHWEKEVEILKGRTLDLDECCRISDLFRKDRDGLLINKPLELSDEIFLKFDQLDNKLCSALAMVCGCFKNNSI